MILEWVDKAEYAILAEDYYKGKNAMDGTAIRQVDAALHEKKEQNE